MAPPDSPDEERERKPWTGFAASTKRLWARQGERLLGVVLAALFAAAVIPWLLGMVILPSTVGAQGLRITSVENKLTAYIEADSMSARITALNVTFQCLDSDSARFAAALETCGHAMIVSRMDESYYRSIARKKGISLIPNLFPERRSP